MRALKLTPQRVVILYFSGCVALWAGLAFARTPGAAAPALFLGLHAAIVVAAAWIFPRWFFGHASLAVGFCALPIVFLLPAFWVVPALLYVIGTAYVWEASRRERPGQLQPRRRCPGDCTIGKCREPREKEGRSAPAADRMCTAIHRLSKVFRTPGPQETIGDQRG
jgi:hypothetical protein